jgi:CBS domain-containing protein
MPDGDRAAADILQMTALRRGVDLLVMGGYEHGRTRERLFGGCTRAVLGNAILPVLMMHEGNRMDAADILTKDVITVTPETSIRDAIRLMLEHHVSGLPVVTAANELVGIVTEGDFLRRAETGTELERPAWLQFLLGDAQIADEYARAHGRDVADVMTRDVVTADEQTPVRELVRMMEARRIKRLPVLRGNALVGIVSRADLLHALAALDDRPRPEGSGRPLRERVLAEITRQPWVPRGAVNVVVWGSIVELWGRISDERQRQALRVLVANIPGVSEVRDQLVCLPPRRPILT